MRKVYLACDHGGYDLKEKIKKDLFLKSNDLRIEVLDLGPHSDGAVDYPDFADQVAKKMHGFKVVGGKSDSVSPFPMEMGILICGSGQGMAMRANKYPHIRAALVWSKESTLLAREHNDANVLCLGGRLLDHAEALKWVEIFLSTPFAGGRHLGRVLKVSSPLSD